MAKESVVKVYKEAGYLINVRHLTEDHLDWAKKKFTVHLFNQAACDKCPFLEDRLGENCENCASFLGARQLAKTVERGEQTLLSIPYGATDLMRHFLKNKLGKPFQVVDRHPEPIPFSRPIRFTGTLRPYQVEAKAAMLDKKKGVLHAPPRSGKTVMAIATICEIGQKTIIIASQRDWLLQFKSTFLGSDTDPALTNAKPAQIVMCKTYEDFLNADVALATPQQFMNPSGAKLLERIREEFPVLYMDEIHLAPALATSRVLSRFNTTYRIGLTGTPERKQEGLYLIVEMLIGKVLYRAQVDRLRPRVELLNTELTLNLGKQASQGAFSRFVTKVEKHPKRLMMIAKRAIQAVDSGHMVLIPFARTDPCEALVKTINRLRGKRIAAAFHGKLRKDQRALVLERSKQYKTKVLVGNSKLLSTGLNIPRASCLFEGTTLSSNIGNTDQRVSRILTPMDGKPQPLIILVNDDSDILRKTRAKEWWQCIVPRHRPEVTMQDMATLKTWFAGKDAHNLEGKIDI